MPEPEIEPMLATEYRSLKARARRAAHPSMNWIPGTIHEWNDPKVFLAACAQAETNTGGPTNIQGSLIEEEDGRLYIGFGALLSGLRLTKRQAQDFATEILKMVLPDV